MASAMLGWTAFELACPSGATQTRTALPIAGTHAQAQTDAAELIDRLGFDTVDVGSLTQSWRFEPEAAAYTRLYLADPATPDDRMLQATGRPCPWPSCGEHSMPPSGYGSPTVPSDLDRQAISSSP